jgi:hypothetical protein
MAVARDLRGTDESVICVAGDAAFTCGVSYEALNNAAEQTKKTHRRTKRQRVEHRSERRRYCSLL